MRFPSLLPLALTTLTWLAALFVPTTASAQWLGNSDLYLAVSESGAAIFNPLTGEPALLVGVRALENAEKVMGLSRSDLRGMDPFDIPPRPMGPHRGLYGDVEGGWENFELGHSRRTSPDGIHATLILGGQGVLLNVNRPREIRRYPGARMWGFLGPKGEAFALMRFAYAASVLGGSVRFEVRDTASDELLFSRTFPQVSSSRDGFNDRQFPDILLNANGARTGRFLFMRGPGGERGKLMVYDHERREMFDLPFLSGSIALSSDNRLAAFVGNEDYVIVDTETWQVVQMLKGESPDKRLAGGLQMAGFLHDNRYFVASPSFRGLWLFDLETGRMIDTMGGGSRWFETHDNGNILAYSGGYGYALFTTVVDGKLVASDLCPKEHCRPMPGMNGSGSLHLKPDQSGFMITLSPGLIWHDFKSGESRRIVLSPETIQKWLNQHRDAPMGVKCTFYLNACTVTMPDPRAIEDASSVPGAPWHRMYNYRSVQPWWESLCEVVEGGTCLSTITRNQGHLQNGLRAADAMEAVRPAYRDTAIVADDVQAVRELFRNIAEDPCIRSHRSSSCGWLASRLVYLGEVDRLEALCMEILEICRAAATLIEGSLRAPLRNEPSSFSPVMNLERFGPWTEKREAQLQRIARRACFEAIEIRSCRFIPGMELVSSYAETDMSWSTPEARAAWAEYLPKLIERLDAEDRAKGWKLTKITDAQAWARIPTKEREACKLPYSGGLRQC